MSFKRSLSEKVNFITGALDNTLICFKDHFEDEISCIRWITAEPNRLTFYLGADKFLMNPKNIIISGEDEVYMLLETYYIPINIDDLSRSKLELVKEATIKIFDDHWTIGDNPGKYKNIPQLAEAHVMKLFDYISGNSQQYT